MMKAILPALIFSFCSVCFTTALSAQQPKDASLILKTAFTEAATENKNVFVIFHASWCGWCRKMDSSMNDASCKQSFDDNYIICHLVVHESKAKKHLENPGAEELMAKYNGAEQGIPYWLIFDKEGQFLADSRMNGEGVGTDKKGQNTGCPASAEELKYFISVLKRTSRISAVQLQVIEKRFRENEN